MLSRTLAISKGRITTPPALDAFVTSAERALVYSNIHRGSSCGGSTGLAAAAQRLANMEQDGAKHELGIHSQQQRKHELSRIAAYLHQLGEEDVAQVCARSSNSPPAHHSLTCLGGCRRHMLLRLPRWRRPRRRPTSLLQRSVFGDAELGGHADGRRCIPHVDRVYIVQLARCNSWLP